MSDVLKQKIFVIFILAVLLITLVGFLFLNQSLAWFASNKTVTANGFSLKSTVSSNLIIGRTVDDLTAENLQFSIDFNTAVRDNMIAVTHDSAVPDTYLKYVAHSYAIDNETGLSKDGSELAFKPVLAENSERYYIDFTIYLASAFEELPVSALEASIVIPDTVDSIHPYFNAASIDFFVGEASLDNYVGTLSLAESLAGGTIDILRGEGGTVPLNTAGCITVTIRCYFDGALVGSDGRAYINSHTVRTDSIALGVNFTAKDKLR